MIQSTQAIAINNNCYTDALKTTDTTLVLASPQNNAFSNITIDNRASEIYTATTSIKNEFISNFNRVVARVNLKEITVINKKLEDVTQNELADLQYICSNPKAIHWEKKDFILDDNFAYVVLKALQQNYISSSEFATLTSLQTVILELMQQNNSINNNDQLPIVFNNLFNENKSCNHSAWNSIRESIKNTFIDDAILVADIDKIISIMQQTMLTKTSLEAGFWIFIKKNKDNKNNISYKIKSFGVDLLLNVNRRLKMFPSMSIRQEFLNATFGKMSCNINPVIGTSSVIDLRNEALLFRSRDFAIPFPLLPLPKQADGREANSIIDFQYHDAYHALQISMLKDSHLKFYIAVGDLLAELKSKFFLIKKQLETIVKKKITLYEAKIEALDIVDKNKASTLLQKKICKTKQLISALDNTRKAIGRFKFKMYDLEMPYPQKQQEEYLYMYGEIGYHLINLSFLLNSSYIFNGDKFLANFFLKIIGRKIIVFINTYFSDSLATSIALKKVLQMFQNKKQQLLIDIHDLSENKQKIIINQIINIERSIKFLQAIPHLEVDTDNA